MPGSLERFRRRPSHILKRDWKGPGVYYHRGNGVYSKYSAKRDLQRGSTSTTGRGRRKQTHDRRFRNI